MIRKSDIRWWVLEVTKHPEAAPQMIEALAGRLVELDAFNEQLRDELIQLRRRLTKRTDTRQVAKLQRQVHNLQRVLEHQSSSGSLLIFVTEDMKTAAVPLPAAQEIAISGAALLDGSLWPGICSMELAWPGDQLLLLTNQGRAFGLAAAEVEPLAAEPKSGSDPTFQLNVRERVTAVATCRIAPRLWTAVTRKGYAQRLVHAAVSRQMGTDIDLLKSPHHNDAAVSMVDGERGDLLVVTRWGNYACFPQRMIENQGSQTVDLEPGDQAAAGIALPQDHEVLIVTAAGYAMRRDTQRLNRRSKPGGVGRKLIQAQDVMAVLPYSADAHLALLTYSGRILLFPLADIPLLDRFGKGTQLRDLGRDPIIAATLIQQAD